MAAQRMKNLSGGSCPLLCGGGPDLISGYPTVDFLSESLWVKHRISHRFQDVGMQRFSWWNQPRYAPFPQAIRTPRLAVLPLPPPIFMPNFISIGTAASSQCMCVTDTQPDGLAVPLHYVARPQNKSAAAFADEFLAQPPPPPKKNIRLSWISRLAAEIFDQPADSRKKSVHRALTRLWPYCKFCAKSALIEIWSQLTKLRVRTLICSTAFCATVIFKNELAGALPYGDRNCCSSIILSTTRSPTSIERWLCAYNSVLKRRLSSWCCW